MLGFEDSAGIIVSFFEIGARERALWSVSVSRTGAVRFLLKVRVVRIAFLVRLRCTMQVRGGDYSVLMYMESIFAVAGEAFDRVELVSLVFFKICSVGALLGSPIRESVEVNLRR